MRIPSPGRVVMFRCTDRHPPASAPPFPSPTISHRSPFARQTQTTPLAPRPGFSRDPAARVAAPAAMAPARSERSAIAAEFARLKNGFRVASVGVDTAQPGASLIPPVSPYVGGSRSDSASRCAPSTPALPRRHKFARIRPVGDILLAISFLFERHAGVRVRCVARAFFRSLVCVAFDAWRFPWVAFASPCLRLGAFPGSLWRW